VNVEVVIPWRGGCPHRDRALAWVLGRWLDAGFAATVAETGGCGPWRKADAVNPAVAASGADLVVVADADVWCDGITAAVAAVEGGAPWAIPHRLVWRLDETASDEVTSDRLDLGRVWMAHTEQTPYTGVAAGGMLVARRGVLVDVPLDRRFAGWGGEDHAWGYALGTLHGQPWRGRAPLWHLWHPTPERVSRIVGSQESEALRRRYWLAIGHRESMRAIVEEAKCPTS